MLIPGVRAVADPRPPGCSFHLAARTFARSTSASCHRCAARVRPGHLAAAPADRAERAAIWRACRPARRPGRARRSSQRGAGRPASASLVQVRDLELHFPIKQGIVFQRQVGAVRAVDGISFDVREGETLGLVGESGCGKSTTARAVMRLLEPTGGTVSYQGQDITTTPRELLPSVRDADDLPGSYSSLDPRQTVGSVIGEPFVIHGIEKDERRRKQMVQQLMEQVGSTPSTTTACRTSSPAASASGSASPARWR